MRQTGWLIGAVLIGGSLLPLRLFAATPTHVWVDARWTGPAACGEHTWHTDAFATIQAGITAVAEGGTVTVRHLCGWTRISDYLDAISEQFI